MYFIHLYRNTNKMKKICLTILVCFSFFPLLAQNFTVSGKVSDQKGNPIPFATIYLKNASLGTSANGEGLFTLKIPSGKQELVFRAVGFKQLIQQLIVTQNQINNVTLAEEIYQLKDVIVRADGEDPAYQIIRKAIKQRKKYLKETPAYTCEVYIKGVQKLLKAPKKFLGNDIGKFASEAGLDSNRTGIIYQSESQSLLSFLPPKSYKEVMVSSKVAGSNRSFSFNRATDLMLNFYENYQDWGSLSNRPFVSPIADNALFYYDYKLIGSSLENGEMINKIQLLPKRKYDPAYRGYIYIVEDSWRIHSTDFLMSKESNIAILDSLKINQQFIPVDRKTWMPANVKFEFSGGLFGFRFGGYSVGIYSNYNLKPELKEQDFKEVLKITKEVNKKDSVFWSEARPVPLTAEETVNYTKKDSIAKRRESKPYLDSLDKVNNNFKLSKLLLTGYNPRNRYEKEFYHIDGILPSVLYNTVEGFAINYGATYTKNIDTLNNRFLRLAGNLRYGFSNKLFSANTSAVVPVGRLISLNAALGSDVVDLNDKGSLRILSNSINSLIFETNYSKLYQKKFGNVGISSRIFGGLNGSFNLGYNNYKWLPNSSTYAFRNDKNNDFTSNNPFTPSIDQPLFSEYQSLKLRFTMSYNFSNRYVTYPQGKFYLKSKWPTVTFNYLKALPKLLGSDTDYDFASLGVRKSNIKLGFYGDLDVSVEAGKFLTSSKVFYPEFKHFRGNRTLGFEIGQNQFLLLDYYKYSTNLDYFEAHAEHNFSGFFTNKIPLLRKLKLQEFAGVNYLATPNLKNYTEFYFGVSYTGFKFYYGFAYDGGRQVQSGFRLATSL